jgi:hypothetical protein
MKSRDKLHRRFLQTQDKKDWEAYKESRNNVKNKLKKAASNYLSEEVEVLAMPKNKSPGPDKINIRILGPLTHIINSSLLTGVFPKEWKLSEVTPLHKDGDNEVASNNRPISLLEIMSKVCERVALDQFSSYLTTNHRLSPHQRGNRKAHYTETLNILVSDTMLEAIDKKNVTAVVLLDMSKAFDSVSHPILLHKLKCVGASSQAVGWFKSYLSGRRQYVRIGSTVSSVLPLSHGVPQGTILSPLLFCIYTNDIPAIPLSSNIDSYVDDSKLFLTFSVKDIKQTIVKLENDLRSVAKWCFEHQNTRARSPNLLLRMHAFLWIWWRDDICFVWLEGEDKLLQFMKRLNEFHPSLTFTCHLHVK